MVGRESLDEEKIFIDSLHICIGNGSNSRFEFSDVMEHADPFGGMQQIQPKGFDFMVGAEDKNAADVNEGMNGSSFSFVVDENSTNHVSNGFDFMNTPQTTETNEESSGFSFMN